jgi:hypothetical protein
MKENNSIDQAHAEIDGFGESFDSKPVASFMLTAIGCFLFIAMFCTSNVWFTERTIELRIEALHDYNSVKNFEFEENFFSYSKVQVNVMGQKKTYLINAGFLSEAEIIEVLFVGKPIGDTD